MFEKKKNNQCQRKEEVLIEDLRLPEVDVLSGKGS